jgi:hypothetical protein
MDRVIVRGKCWKCGDSVTMALWEGPDGKKYTCYFCGSCGLEYGKVGDAGTWHSLGVPSLYWRNYLYAAPVPDSHALKLSKRR